jgi:hypothetical protein
VCGDLDGDGRDGGGAAAPARHGRPGDDWPRVDPVRSRVRRSARSVLSGVRAAGESAAGAAPWLELRRRLDCGSGSTRFRRLSVTSRRTAPLSSLLDFTGDRTTDIEDLVVATKIRLVPEASGRPAIGLRFATKLPNAGNESGLGLDTTDFYASLLIGKTVQSIRVVANVGVGILPDPTVGHRQNDVFTYGLSVARAIRQGVEVVGEVNGRSNQRDADDTPPGTESRSTFRAGARLTRGTVRVDGGVIVGMTSRDPSIGFTAGLTWVFRAFNIP